METPQTTVNVPLLAWCGVVIVELLFLFTLTGFLLFIVLGVVLYWPIRDALRWPVHQQIGSKPPEAETPTQNGKQE